MQAEHLRHLWRESLLDVLDVVRVLELGGILAMDCLIGPRYFLLGNTYIVPSLMTTGTRARMSGLEAQIPRSL